MENIKALVLDIESNSLLADMLDYSAFPYKLRSDAKLWWVVIRNVYTGEVFKASREEITKEWMQTHLQGCTHLAGHNAIKFDFIVLKLFGVLDYTIGYFNEPDTLFGEKVIIVDTLILSRLLNPDRFGGHSLENWGKSGETQKIDFRSKSIELGLIEKNAPQGHEFTVFSDLMGDYCVGDTLVNADVFLSLVEELKGHNWSSSIKIENKLADLAVRRESLGFWFDKDLAIKCVEDLTQKMEELQNKVNPILPPKPRTKGEMHAFTPPKTQLTKDGLPSSFMKKFAERVGAEIKFATDEWCLEYKEMLHKIPFEYSLETTTSADISNLDHVKSTLIDVYNWEPSEWAERDFTKDSKKQSLPFDKRKTALERWLKETTEGKYKKLRLKIAFENYKAKNEVDLLDKLLVKLKEDFPVRLPTSPKVRVGVEKDLCPNLIKLGEKVDFANDFALFLTYKHRKSSIAGGEIEDMDFDNEAPNSGFLSMYREVDGRIPTPAIEIGSNTSRYRHIGVCNIARPTSVYGKEMRSLFGAGKGAVFFGFDYASAEARIMASYVHKYTGGVELGKTFIAEKPNDLHTKMSLIMNVPRPDAKSINFGIIYGASWNKIKKMTGKTTEESKGIVAGFWDNALALKELKEKASEYWRSTGSKFVIALDGRKIFIRSEHSILNALFQSGSVIFAKYVSVLFMEKLEKTYNLCTDPFIKKPDVCSMIEYHDEQALFTDPQLFTFKTFETKEEAEAFSSEWEGEQLSAISQAKGKYYITFPNPISLSVIEAMKEAEQLLNIKVSMGFEYMVGRTWYDCH